MNEDITVVIAIGGKGTRLKNITGEIPKLLYPIVGTSTLKRALNELTKYGFKKLILTTCFKKEIFKGFFTKNKFYFDEFIIFEENEPLGECGALCEIKNKLQSRILFINGDLIFSMNFKKLIDFHNRMNSDITLVTHPSSHPEDSDMVSCPNGTFVETLFLKSRESSNDKYRPLLGFSGISLFNKSIIDDLNSFNDLRNTNLFGSLVFTAFLNKKRIYSYNTSEYIKDMGTEKRLKEVSEAIKNNLLSKKNYSNKQSALFIDRDNTLIKCKTDSYILSVNDICFIEENIRKLADVSNKFTLVAIVTNQPQLSMNKLTLEELENINNHVIEHCRKNSLLIDTVIWCPHHPHKGFEEEISLLKKDCFCRKPNPGMLIELAFQRNIDFDKSLFIGDSSVDKIASEAVNCRFINILDL